MFADKELWILDENGGWITQESWDSMWQTRPPVVVGDPPIQVPADHESSLPKTGAV